jgi:DUF4097 and DUF4098 domain-containing protein YvlB
MCQEIIYKHMNGKISISNITFEYKSKTYKGALTRITLQDIIND